MKQYCGFCSRRSFLTSMSGGLFGVAVASLLQREGLATPTGQAWAPPDGLPHFPPRAKSVIWLFLNGGMSHLESFDPKPMVNQYAGMSIANTPWADVQSPARLAMNNRVVVVNDANGQQ